MYRLEHCSWGRGLLSRCFFGSRCRDSSFYILETQRTSFSYPFSRLRGRRKYCFGELGKVKGDTVLLLEWKGASGSEEFRLPGRPVVLWPVGRELPPVVRSSTQRASWVIA